jgi:hypothetical protein
MNSEATVRVRMTENSFVEYGGGTHSGHYETRSSVLGGKPRRMWIGDEFWCTPEAAAAWTTTRGGKPADRPPVIIIGRRSDEI